MDHQDPSSSNGEQNGRAQENIENTAKQHTSKEIPDTHPNLIVRKQSGQPVIENSTAPTETIQSSDETSESVLEDLQAPANTSENLEPTQTTAKPKKKKKKSGKNRVPHPSGFEEFYADPPITPDDYNEEIHDIYHHSRSFVERIEQCIQRYRARRKLDERRANVFNKYLTLGGIDTSLKSFTGGIDQETMEAMTAAEITAAQASDHIRFGIKNKKFYDPSDANNWVVDFQGVVKGFLSHKAPRLFGADSEKEILEYCGVIRNFLNYVLSHSVCPEYTNDIFAARKICDLAEKELWAIHQVQKLLPGEFNKAASTLYGGCYHGLQDDSTWTDDPGPISKSSAAITKADAHRVFMTAVSWVGDEKHFERLCTPGAPPRVVKEEFRSMEVVAITPPDEQMQMAFSGTKDAYGAVGNIRPLGVLEVKPWDNPEAPEEDYSAEMPVGKHDDKSLCNETFWVEGDILEKCFIGMKFEAVVGELDMGIKYFGSVSGIYCSFFTFLPNELIHDWKEPVPNPRPAPSVDDPEKLEVFLEGKGDDDF